MIIDKQKMFMERTTKTVADASRQEGIVKALVRVADKDPAMRRAIATAARAELERRRDGGNRRA